MTQPTSQDEPHAEDWIICGRAAIDAVFKNRPKALRKLWLMEENQGPMGEICSYLADEKRSYSTQTFDRLTRVVKHPNHEGAVAFIDPPLKPQFQVSHLVDWQKSGEPLLIIDQVSDPIELGRLLKVAVSFNMRRALITDTPMQAPIDGAVYSASQGALEHIRCYKIGRLVPLFKPMEQYFLSIGIGGPGASRPNWPKPLRAPGRSPALIISDRPEGIDKRIVPLCEHRVYVPTKGPMSLSPAENLATLLAWLTVEGKQGKDRGFRARQAAKKEQKKK
ncbi:RNA methyltransferase [Cerasicoccus maritimus]|uniref:RNA methyltransferase n=1 Tax=Cerasicoccus maritimus TaxID=490089 RepID=UPI00285298EA|nr:RNA methyltransferase [Cerasicoccus maritimus]